MRKASFAPGEFFHLYNRGTEKRNIFTQKVDYERFLSLLYVCNGNVPVHLQLQGRTLKEVLDIDRGKAVVKLCAYVLMPNHFHLLVREVEDGGISRFIQKLTTGYTMYFNKRYDRSGVLFQGKFKATHVTEDSYLKYLVSYIHLNPVKLIDPKWKENGIKDRKRAEIYLRDYKYSSFLDFTGKIDRPEHELIDTGALPDYFAEGLDFKENIKEWLEYKNLQGPTLK